MTRSRILAGTAALACIGAGWSGYATPPTPPVDLVATAAGRELSAEQLALYFSRAQVTATRINIAASAELWTSYQLLGYAGAHHDSLALSDARIDELMWDRIIAARVEHGYYDRIRRTFTPPDTINLTVRYERGEFLAAQHILFRFPEGSRGRNPRVQDSIRARAQSVLAKVTSANFSEMARQYTEEPEGKERGGSLGVFPRGPAPGSMVPMFELALTTLKPGQIAPVVIKTEFGYHIIRRHLLSEVRPQFVAQLASLTEPAQREAFLRRLRAGANIVFTAGATARIRSGVGNRTAGELKADTTVLATSRLGAFTMRRLAQWMETLSKSSSIPNKLAAGADSTVRRLVTTFIEEELLNDDAIKAGIEPDTGEVHKARSGFATIVNIAAQGLRLDPASLDEENKRTMQERERFAAQRAEEMFATILATGEQHFVEIPPPLGAALAAAYPSRINYDAVDFVVERVKAMRMAFDSMRVRAKR